MPSQQNTGKPKMWPKVLFRKSDELNSYIPTFQLHQQAHKKPYEFISAQLYLLCMHPNSAFICLCFLFLPVPVSAPVIRALGNVIVGRPFRVLCKADNGTLPITYKLLKDRSPVAERRVMEAADMAIFDIPSISYPLEINRFTCQAYNQEESLNRTSSPLKAPVMGERVDFSPHICVLPVWLQTEANDYWYFWII